MSAATRTIGRYLVTTTFSVVLTALPSFAFDKTENNGSSVDPLYSLTDPATLLETPRKGSNDTVSLLDGDLSERPAEFVSAPQRGFCVGHRSRILPNGLLYRSYIAAPHESRFSTAVLHDASAGETRWDSTLGGRVGLFRRDRPARMNLEAWQIDLEGAVIARLSPEDKMDIESTDFRFGLLWTGKRDRYSFKAGYFHVSSHVGDEYLIKNPTFNRINYVRESLVFGTAVQATPEWRVYGEVAWAPVATGGAEPWQIQYGAEYSKLAPSPTRGAPFVACNLHHRQETDFAAGANLMTGWQWRSRESGRSFRVGLQYYNGPSNQFEFFERHDNQLGFGIWFDY